MPDENLLSYPTVKIQELFSYLLYCSDGGFHYGWKEYIPIQKLLKNQPELLKTFMDIMTYDSSPTTKTEETEK